jgi:Spy/CpxP family protein refolding chaperone
MKKTGGLMLTQKRILFLIAFLLFGQGFAFGPKMGKIGPLSHIPNLTTDQMNKIEKLRLQHEKEILPLSVELQKKEIELESLLGEGVDDKRIDDKVEEIGRIRVEINKKQVRHRLAVLKILTNEQRVYFDQGGKWHRCRCW